MEVSFFQNQNGINNDDVINGCGLFLVSNSCYFVLRLLLPNDTCQVLQRHIKLQSGAKKLQSGAAQKLQSGAKQSQSGAGITKWGITGDINIKIIFFVNFQIKVKFVFFSAYVLKISRRAFFPSTFGNETLG